MKRFEPFTDKLFVINKSSGPSSYDVVRAFKKATSVKRVGHAGTLDPLAQGVLLLITGRATRAADYLMDLEKTYVFDLFLGVKTTTLDGEGEPVETRDCPEFSEREIEETVGCFIGEYQQVPPAFSALKTGGKRMYELAREGKKPEVKKRKVTIYDLRVLNMELPVVRLELRCSRGTYVRALARDFGEKLGMPAHVRRLIRSKVGPFTIEDSLPDNVLFEGNSSLISGMDLSDALSFLPAVVIDEESKRGLLNGVPPLKSGVLTEIGDILPGGPLRILDKENALLAVGEGEGCDIGETGPIISSYKLFVNADN